jgi:uncharacterized protein (TIGR03435 family)
MGWRSRHCATYGLILLGVVAATAAASPAQAPPAFEVASVKANTSGQLPQTVDVQPSGRLTIANVPLRRIITMAFGIREWQLENGPGWIGGERFDILAKTPTPAASADLWLMLRTLLTQRFKLIVHTETRDAPVFDLVVSRSDGKLGAGLRRSAVDCAQLMGDARSDDRNPCGHEIGFGRMRMRGMTLDSLAEIVEAQESDRPVVNRTGLAGRFDWEISWTPQAFVERFNRDRQEGRVSGDAPLVNGQRVDLDGPSLATALRDQLGLTLESTKRPVAFVVIDDVQRPTED